MAALKGKAKRADLLTGEGAMETVIKVRALEATGLNFVHLEIGDPDFDTPQRIKDALVSSLQAGNTHYVSSGGTIEARQACASYIAKTRNIEIDWQDVIVSPGSKPAIFASLLLLCDEGDEVVCPNPGFPAYAATIAWIGAKAVYYVLEEEKNWNFDIDAFEKCITPRTKMVILNSPQNPTGGILSKESIECVAKLSQKYGFYVLADEVYSTLSHDGGKYNSIISEPGMRDRTILLESSSKMMAMCGWRAGFSLWPAHLRANIVNVAINSWTCVPKFIQDALIVALQDGSKEETQRMLVEYTKRRDLIVDSVNAIPGLSCRVPAGAFYAFVNIKQTGMTSKEFSDRMIKEANVALLPGSCFGSAGEGYIRLAFCVGINDITKGMEKIRQILSQK